MQATPPIVLTQRCDTHYTVMCILYVYSIVTCIMYTVMCILYVYSIVTYVLCILLCVYCMCIV